MRMRVYSLDFHEAGLCCNLVTRIEQLLRPLQLFTFICDLFSDSPSYTGRGCSFLTSTSTTGVQMHR
jgi:hypothetical protein